MRGLSKLSTPQRCVTGPIQCSSGKVHSSLPGLGSMVCLLDMPFLVTLVPGSSSGPIICRQSLMRALLHTGFSLLHISAIFLEVAKREKKIKLYSPHFPFSDLSDLNSKERSKLFTIFLPLVLSQLSTPEACLWISIS